MFMKRVSSSLSEASYNEAIIHPTLMTVTSTIKNDTIKFIHGEEPLESITNYLRENIPRYDECNVYKADGVITQKAGEGFNTNLMILETSSGYKKTSKTKKTLDHHKATFALLSILKDVADKYSMCSFATFSKFKVYFLRAFDDEMSLYSLCSPSQSIYLMRKEGEMIVPVDYSKRELQLLFYIERYWDLKLKIEEAAQLAGY